MAAVAAIPEFANALSALALAVQATMLKLRLLRPVNPEVDVASRGMPKKLLHAARAITKQVLG